MAEMSLADAIREGSRYTGKATHFYFRAPTSYEPHTNCRACSLGAAMYALRIVDVTYDDREQSILPALNELRETFPELERRVSPPPDFPIHDYREFVSEGGESTLFKMIEILTFEWDRERVADWVEEQVAQMELADAQAMLAEAHVELAEALDDLELAKEERRKMSAIVDAELVPEFA